MNNTLKDQTDIPILYSFRRCPYAMRARMAIFQNEVAVELREVVLRDKPIQMIELSPKATVPVLRLQDGTVLDESLDVMLWAFRQNTLNKQPENRMNCDLIETIDTTFKYHLDRYKYASRYENVNPIQHRDEALAIIGEIENRLVNHWLCGETPGFSDMAILPFMRQFRATDKSWFDNLADIKNTSAWLLRFLEWDCFNSVMKKYPKWVPGDTKIIFGAAYI